MTCETAAITTLASRVTGSNGVEVAELEKFALDVADWFAAHSSPMKTATYYQIQQKAHDLRSKLKPAEVTA